MHRRDAGHAGGPFASHFPNAPFTIDDYIPPTDDDVPASRLVVRAGERLIDRTTRRRCPGGCTRDLVHRYYQEQYQLNGGAQDRYVTGSDAIGLTMGDYDTTALPIYTVPARQGPPRLRDRGQLLPGARSAARSSTTSG